MSSALSPLPGQAEEEKTVKAKVKAGSLQTLAAFLRQDIRSRQNNLLLLRVIFYCWPY